MLTQNTTKEEPNAGLGNAPKSETSRDLEQQNIRNHRELESLFGKFEALFDKDAAPGHPVRGGKDVIVFDPQRSNGLAFLRLMITGKDKVMINAFVQADPTNPKKLTEISFSKNVVDKELFPDSKKDFHFFIQHKDGNGDFVKDPASVGKVLSLIKTGKAEQCFQTVDQGQIEKILNRLNKEGRLHLENSPTGNDNKYRLFAKLDSKTGELGITLEQISGGYQYTNAQTLTVTLKKDSNDTWSMVTGKYSQAMSSPGNNNNKTLEFHPSMAAFEFDAFFKELYPRMPK